MNRLDTLVEKVQKVFLEQFNSRPTTLVQAPGRVNLIGEHTDYNDGFVLPCAIDFQTLIAAAPRQDNLVRVVAVDFDRESDSFNLDQVITPNPDQPWANYVRGMVKHLQQHGHSFAGADLVISGSVPMGSGLSSSASLEIAIGQTFKSLYRLDLSPRDLALIGQEAENRFVGCNCGIMDQLISVLGVAGSALLLDCRSLDTRAVPIPEGLALVIINSNVSRGLVDSAYNLRREHCEQAAHHFQVKALRDVSIETFEAGCSELDPVVAKRARHVITENSRVLEAAEALSTADLPKLAMLMAQSHQSMRDDFEITVPAIDTIVEMVSQTIGNQGGVRMTGGGFGGCVVALIADQLVDDVRHTVEAQYQSKTGLKESIYVCHAAAGAGEIIC